MAPRHRLVATRLSPALIDLVQRRDVSIIGLLPASRLLAGGCFWNYDPPARALPIPAGQRCDCHDVQC